MDYAAVTEEICAKCVLGGTGGTEPPCLPWASIREIQRKEPGAFCPREKLSLENRGLATLALFATKIGGDHSLFQKLFDLEAAELEPEQRLAAFYRIIAAVCDEGVAARIKRARARDRASEV